VDSVVVQWLGGPREVWRDLEADRTWELERGKRPVARDAKMSREDTLRFWEQKQAADELLLAGRWEEAILVLQHLLELDPRHEDSLYNLGNCRLEMGEYAAAQEAWQELVRVPPTRRSRALTGSTRSIAGP
jgi:tetratricopeptide (TPR) repeat protein